jgi:hypothetical protein
MFKLPLSSSTFGFWLIWSFTGRPARSRRGPSPTKQASRGLVAGGELGSAQCQLGRPSGLRAERARWLDPKLESTAVATANLPWKRAVTAFPAGTTRPRRGRATRPRCVHARPRLWPPSAMAAPPSRSRPLPERPRSPPARPRSPHAMAAGLPSAMVVCRNGWRRPWAAL